MNAQSNLRTGVSTVALLAALAAPVLLTPRERRQPAD
jgi:hypothetical protein